MTVVIPSNKKIGEFSKGMKMKLQIACALSHEAELLIMDEATTGLDPVVRDDILHIFLEYMHDGENHLYGERSILLSSHITSDLEKIADSVTFIDRGKLLISGRKSDIIQSHSTSDEASLEDIMLYYVKGASLSRSLRSLKQTPRA